MSDFKALAKHSTNYLFAIMATKALAFISIPVYTRLLSVYEYGIINVFMSTVGIVQVLLTLNTEVAISRYYYDAKNEQDFKEFCSTSIKISSGVWLLMSLIMVMLNSERIIDRMNKYKRPNWLPIAFFLNQKSLLYSL